MNQVVDVDMWICPEMGVVSKLGVSIVYVLFKLVRRLMNSK